MRWRSAVRSTSRKRIGRCRTGARCVEKLAEEKDMMKEFTLYKNVERLAPLVIGDQRHIYKGVSANVDFYSGLVYSMLDIPHELYTPLFAIARIAGWSAHRIEELVNAGRIIRPAYKAVGHHKHYVPMKYRGDDSYKAGAIDSEGWTNREDVRR